MDNEIILDSKVVPEMYLRCFAQTSSDEILPIIMSLREKIEKWCDINQCVVKSHKADQVEIFMRFQSRNLNTKNAFQALTNHLAKKWKITNNSWAFWEYKTKSWFIIDCVVWACLEIINSDDTICLT